MFRHPSMFPINNTNLHSGYCSTKRTKRKARQTRITNHFEMILESGQHIPVPTAIHIGDCIQTASFSVPEDANACNDHDADDTYHDDDHYATLLDIRSTESMGVPKNDGWSDNEVDTLLGLYETHMNKLRSDQTVNLFWAAIAQRMQSKAFDVSLKTKIIGFEISN